MDKIGVYFEVPMDNYNLNMESILELFLKIENYNWRITENDVLAKINDDWEKYRFLGGEEFGNGSNLKKELQEIDYYPMFLNLEAYPPEIPILEIKNIPVDNIPEFLNSKCSLIVVIIDCYEIAIFVKNIKDFPNIQQEILSQGYENFRFIDKSANWRFS
ncbi:hypothetical protein COM13_30035 [Bacillus pseudomycoides]|uniref:DUF2691 family protein n=1 Tax=Bacillus pseudomycoides TaxID=64104 RepID=UPI000BEC267E|nr:DUF2691 family protein [Bacillus pseudomycoides]MED4654504.1 DUF2691 family protein [Bacillus pseudomycoides]PDX97075.1 hypothetical protein COO07_29585 [Bacillus pseudomycoides]PEE03548.1 hypothetical protein CON86_24850 [Bacillus pseudomycoides]PEI52385.1 hypothetical protein CN641_00345 [Bacillus pseudomycoides]PEK74069.1 hypothetical protein CN597_26975 [Bacillus pseudomycoides]